MTRDSRTAEPVAWMDEFGNVFPLAANKGAGHWLDDHKRNWKPLYASPVPHITAEQVEQLKRLADAAIHAAISYGEATAPNVGEKLDEHLKARAAFHAALDALVKETT